MALLRCVSIFAAAYFMVALISLMILGDPHWGGCFTSVVRRVFSSLHRVVQLCIEGRIDFQVALSFQVGFVRLLPL
ncbi:hypothetical protein SAMN05216228_103558 [Rhizobium tibeticum]|uniref:Uncharacterized protein n=1 Tax=Rhizobium tibeticum TaxID=501024 RepID=A0A1H8UPD9_9HYPH|nr:hypothetical protein RTCCBAU85039_5698 [Rhizobium tibeticum]SEP05090.1 hypothetical protein SAMN05216228_103558 [Rhizobium tibeticum]